MQEDINSFRIRTNKDVHSLLERYISDRSCEDELGNALRAMARYDTEKAMRETYRLFACFSGVRFMATAASWLIEEPEPGRNARLIQDRKETEDRLATVVSWLIDEADIGLEKNALKDKRAAADHLISAADELYVSGFPNAEALSLKAVKASERVVRTWGIESFPQAAAWTLRNFRNYRNPLISSSARELHKEVNPIWISRALKRQDRQQRIENYIFFAAGAAVLYEAWKGLLPFGLFTGIGLTLPMGYNTIKLLTDSSHKTKAPSSNTVRGFTREDVAFLLRKGTHRDKFIFPTDGYNRERYMKERQQADSIKDSLEILLQEIDAEAEARKGEREFRMGKGGPIAPRDRYWFGFAGMAVDAVRILVEDKGFFSRPLSDAVDHAAQTLAMGALKHENLIGKPLAHLTASAANAVNSAMSPELVQAVLVLFFAAGGIMFLDNGIRSFVASLTDEHYDQLGFCDDRTGPKTLRKSRSEEPPRTAPCLTPRMGG